MTTALVAMTTGIAHANPTLYAGGFNVGATLQDHDTRLARQDERNIDTAADIAQNAQDIADIAQQTADTFGTAQAAHNDLAGEVADNATAIDANETAAATAQAAAEAAQTKANLVEGIQIGIQRDTAANTRALDNLVNKLLKYLMKMVTLRQPQQ